MSTTTNPKDPKLAQVGPATGMKTVYLVLPQLEPELGPAKLWKRPYRDSYRHTGKGPSYPTRRLTEEEASQHNGSNYVAFEPYPPIRYPVTGRYWTQRQLDEAVGCNGVTVLGQELASTFARDPSFYGATFCFHCRKHFKVDQFSWILDGQRVGS